MKGGREECGEKEEGEDCVCWEDGERGVAREGARGDGGVGVR